MIKTIETEYNGYKFRSRLEARWAVFLDEIGIKYLYEPEGFEINFGEEKIKYLPDFYFPDCGFYGEVKGNPFTDEEKEKLSYMTDFNGVLANGLIFFGNIPSENEMEQNSNELLFPFIWWHGQGLAASFAKINLLGKRFKAYKEYIFEYFEAPDLYFKTADQLSLDYVWKKVQENEWQKIRSCSIEREIKQKMKKARQARFEYQKI